MDFRSVDFKGVDLIRYDALLRVLLDNIRKDRMALGQEEYKADFDSLHWLMASLVIAYRDHFPNATKQVFLSCMDEVYEGMEPYLDNEEVK